MFMVGQPVVTVVLFYPPKARLLRARHITEVPAPTQTIIRDTRQELRAQSPGPSARLRESTIPSLFFDWFS
jgi:hypothetical protein